MKLLLQKHATASFLCVLWVVIQVVTSQTLHQRQRQDCSQRCQCSAVYQPFCGTDEATYSNKCQLECAQNCDRSLRIKFEGVCAVPYVHEEGDNNNRRRPSFTSPVSRNTPRPYYQPNPTTTYGWTPPPPRQYVAPILPSQPNYRPSSYDTQPQQRQPWYGPQGK